MSGAAVHWTPPHTVEDVLAAARRPGAAAPSEIHVRTALHARMLQEASGPGVPVTVDPQRGISHLDGIPVVVDDELPAFPGYEIHRACAPDARAAAA